MRVVSYTRATTLRVGEENPKNTIGIQNGHILRYIKERGWVLSEKYSDRKFSEEETAAFEQLTEDGMNRKFDCVVLDSVFRCGNSMGLACEILLQTFYPAGIQFAIVEDDFFSAEKKAEEVERYIRAKQFRSLLDLSYATYRQNRENGLLSSHNRRYGYLISPDRKGMIMDETVMKTVQNIFGWYLSGVNFTAIADRLNEAGVMSPMEQKVRAIGTEPDFVKDSIWRGSSVRAILKNPIYMGKAHCMMNGTETIINVPSMVSEAAFHKVQEKLLENENRTKSWKTCNANILYKRIYDKETGQPLMCMKSPFAEDEQVYTLEKRFRYLSKKERTLCISRDTVLAAVREAILRESTAASAVDRILQTGEAERYLEQVLSPYRDKARKQIDRINATYERRMETKAEFRAGRIDQEEYEACEKQYEERFLRCEQEFKEIMAAVEEWRDVVSASNPWVSLYRNIEVPEKLEREDIHRWIRTVTVADYRIVTVQMQEQDWKDRLPQEWFHMEAEV